MNTRSPALLPPDFMPSDYGPALRTHVATLPSMTSVSRHANSSPSFEQPPSPKATPTTSNVVRASHTRRGSPHVDMSKITADSSVNILASEHGFGLMGGLALRRPW